MFIINRLKKIFRRKFYSLEKQARLAGVILGEKSNFIAINYQVDKKRTFESSIECN